MKALTLYQPWATLVALGAKRVETRSWHTHYRGTLAIHAGSRPVPTGARVGDYSVVRDADLAADAPSFVVRWPEFASLNPHERWWALPLGAVVATCTLVDVVPTAALGWTGLWEGWAWQGPNGACERHVHSSDDPAGGRSTIVAANQRPLGDFSPGRYAWLLADVQRVAEPVPARGRQRLWEWRQ